MNSHERFLQPGPVASAHWYMFLTHRPRVCQVPSPAESGAPCLPVGSDAGASNLRVHEQDFMKLLCMVDYESYVSCLCWMCLPSTVIFNRCSQSSKGDEATAQEAHPCRWRMSGNCILHSHVFVTEDVGACDSLLAHGQIGRHMTSYATTIREQNETVSASAFFKFYGSPDKL